MFVHLMHSHPVCPTIHGPCFGVGTLTLHLIAYLLYTVTQICHLYFMLLKIFTKL